MNVIHKALRTLSAVALAGIIVQAANADGQCCARCGCQSGVRRVCRPVYTTKKVEVTCWDCVCEYFCLPARSKCGGCDGGGCGDCCSCTGGPCARCGKARSRNKLIRKTFVKEVPVIEWVVEDVCDCCRGQGRGQGCGQDTSVPTAPLPPTPSVLLTPPPVPPLPEKSAEARVADNSRQAGLFKREASLVEGAIRALGTIFR